MAEQVLTVEYDGKAFEIANQEAREAAISAFCSYHRMRKSDLEDWNHRYILEHVYPCFESAKKLHKVQWPC